MAGRKGSRSGRVRLGGHGNDGISVDVFKLKRKLGPFGAVLVIALILLFMLARHSGVVGQGSDWDTYNNKTFLVTHVVDGDTLHVDHPDGNKRTTVIRFWGIDTPEIQHRSDGPADEPFGREAKAVATELAMGQRVTLLLEPHDQRGNYGRLLAYVILSDGRSLNEILIERGLAHADMRFSHRLLNEYEAIEKQAKREHRGMWARQLAPTR